MFEDVVAAFGNGKKKMEKWKLSFDYFLIMRKKETYLFTDFDYCT